MRYILCSLTTVSFFLSFLLSFLLSFFLFFLVWSLLFIRCSCRVLLLHPITLNDANKRNWQNSPGRGRCPSEIHLTVQHATSQKGSIQDPDGIRTRNPIKRAAVDLRLRPCGHRERPSQKSHSLTHHLRNTSQKYYLLNKTDRILILIRDERDRSICKPFLQSAARSSDVLQHAV